MATEDFTLFVETDPNARLTVTSNTITCDTEVTRDEDTRVYKDFTANHFDDFEHLITTKLTSHTGLGIVWFHFISNLIDDSYNSRTVGNRFVGAFGYNDGVNYQIQLAQWDGSSVTSDVYIALVNTFYYCTIKRLGTTLTLKIYSDSARTILLDTLSLVCSTDTLRYLYGLQSRDDNNATRKLALISKDLDLQEVTPTTSNKNIPNYFNAQFITHH